MTNLERWQLLLDYAVSPDEFIEFGYYYLVSASLQRRVYCGPDHFPCFPNMYVILTADPAIGKGVVIKPVAEMLKYFKLPDPRQKLVAVAETKEEKAVAETLQSIDYRNAIENDAGGNQKKKENPDKPLLIPVAADSTTYEALVRNMAQSFRSMPCKKWDATLQKFVPDIYTHSSLCFCLEEIASLFRKHTEDVVNFLIQAYDCGDYTYDTKTQGKDKIKNCCLNFLGGTTPDFMNSTFNDALINQGFSSRAFFIFAAKNRKKPFWAPDQTVEQLQAKQELIQHIEKLTKLVGRAKFTKEADEVLEKWWEKQDEERPNTNPKLAPYYGRKKVHVLKLAMAMHFGESTVMEIGKWAVEKALTTLAREEKKMHLCLGLDNANPLAKLCGKVHHFIAYSPSKSFTMKELTTALWESIPEVADKMEAMQEVLEHLDVTNKIRKLENAKHPVSGHVCTLYTSVKQSDL